MDAGREIAKALAAIEAEDEEREQRERYRRAMAVLREIPNGTADVDLTPEQRRAWKDHDEALAWFEMQR